MIIWNPDLIAFQIGSLAIRWYSLFWTIGLAAAYVIVWRLYREQRIPQAKFDPLFIYCFLGILIGARLGHCLLYEPGYFLSHPLEMILPMRQDGLGHWHFTGYAGLASHGGTAGLMLALWLYVRSTKVRLFRVLDNIAIATPVTAGCIRLGNLMNSEIVGTYTHSDFGFVFARLGETQPRHPAQLYEAIAYFVLLLIGWLIYRSHREKVGTGFFFWSLSHVYFCLPFRRRVLQRGARALGTPHARLDWHQSRAVAFRSLHFDRALLHVWLQTPRVLVRS